MNKRELFLFRLSIVFFTVICANFSFALGVSQMYEIRYMPFDEVIEEKITTLQINNYIGDIIVLRSEDSLFHVSLELSGLNVTAIENSINVKKISLNPRKINDTVIIFDFYISDDNGTYPLSNYMENVNKKNKKQSLSTKIKVSVPDSLESLQLNTSMGIIQVDKLRLTSLRVLASMSDVFIADCFIDDECKIDISMGNLQIKRGSEPHNKWFLNVSMGNIELLFPEISGLSVPENNIKLTMGRIILNGKTNVSFKKKEL